MPPENNDKTIKITLDDLANVAAPEAVAGLPAAQTPGGKVYGSINEPADPTTQVAEEKGSGESATGGSSTTERTNGGGETG